MVCFVVASAFSKLRSVCVLDQHKVRLGRYKRDSDSIQREGENLKAVWSPDTKFIAVIVSLESNSIQFNFSPSFSMHGVWK